MELKFNLMRFKRMILPGDKLSNFDLERMA